MIESGPGTQAALSDMPNPPDSYRTIRENALAVFEENRIISEQARSRASSARERALRAQSLFEDAHRRGARTIVVMWWIRTRRYGRFGPILASLPEHHADGEPQRSGDDPTEARRVVRATAHAVLKMISLAEEITSHLPRVRGDGVKMRATARRMEAREKLEDLFDEVDSALRELRAVVFHTE